VSTAVGIAVDYISDVEINITTMAVLFMSLSEYFGATFSAHAH
jgi:hypothetical protein